MKYITFLIFLLLSLISLGQIDSKVYSVDTSFLKTKNLKGSLKKLEWESQTMDEIRSITIYEPFEFHKDSTYDVVMVTDNQAERVANAMENKMINQEIKPFIIVGINNREPQAIDTIFGSSKIDFRTTEMLGYMFLSSEDVDFSIPNIVMNLSNRKISFRKFIVDEVSSYLIDHYNLKERNSWTLGGFSNGGAFVVDVTTTFPKSFGYVITMSPAGGVRNVGYDFDYSKTKSKYFICAGINEEGFYKNSLTLAKDFKTNDIKFEHKSYEAGHDYNMWLSYYIEILTKIYKL